MVKGMKKIVKILKEINNELYYGLILGNDLYLEAMEIDKEYIIQCINNNQQYEIFIHFYHFLCDLFAYIENFQIKVKNKKILALKNFYECIKHKNNAKKVQNSLTKYFKLMDANGNNISLKFSNLDNEVIKNKTRSNKEIKNMRDLHNQNLYNQDILDIIDDAISYSKQKGENDGKDKNAE